MAAKDVNVEDASPAVAHLAVTPSDTVNHPWIMRALFAKTDGNLAVVDQFGTAETYPVKAGDVIPVRSIRVNATGTTATAIGWK